MQPAAVAADTAVAADPAVAADTAVEPRPHAAGRGRDEQAPAEILDVPDFDAQSFANMLRDMAKTSRLQPAILGALDFDAQSFANTLQAMTKTSRPLPEILDVPDSTQSSPTRCGP